MLKSLWRSLLKPRRETATAATAPNHAPRVLVRHETVNGVFCLPADAAGDPFGRAIAAGEPLATARLAQFRRYAVPGSVAIDVGAGLGRTTLALSGLVGPAGQVLAFEADKFLRDALEQTLRFGEYENVRVFHTAVGDGSRPTVAMLPPSADAPYSSARVASGQDGPVPARSLDSLCIDAAVSLLHIDANGSEPEVLRGAKATMARWRMPIICRTVSARRAEIAGLLKAAGYRIAAEDDAGTCLALPHETIPATANATSPARPALRLPAPPALQTCCKLLRSRADVDLCTNFLRQSGYIQHGLACKNWDLAHILPAINGGNVLDMGSCDSYILKNLALKRCCSELHGIDLRAPDVPVSGVQYAVGDLMQTGLPAGHFHAITCLSVLEHAVDYKRFTAEAARLLAPGGRLFVTFDYWEPKVTPPVKLYDLAWQPLDAALLRELIAAGAEQGLALVEPFDFTSGDAVIAPGYFSPHPEMRYTFGMAFFDKQ